MPKERINITVDESVKEALDRRDDINVSGAANEFFSEYLSGSDRDRVAKEMKIQRLKAEEEELQDRAQRKRAAWQRLEDELGEEKRTRKDALDERLQTMAEQNMFLKKGHVSVVNIAEDFFDGDIDAAYRALIERNRDVEIISDDQFLDA